MYSTRIFLLNQTEFGFEEVKLGKRTDENWQLNYAYTDTNDFVLCYNNKAQFICIFISLYDSILIDIININYQKLGYTCILVQTYEYGSHNLSYVDK